MEVTFAPRGILEINDARIIFRNFRGEGSKYNKEGDEPFIYLPVKVKFNDRGPALYLRSGRNQIKLSEETVSMLDDIDILSVDMDLRPYDDEINGKPFRSAYLQSIFVTQEIDRFAARYAEEESPRE